MSELDSLELYKQVSFRAAKQVTQAYSSSFGLAIMLFPKTMRPQIYNIYGLVRIADEVVDSYRGAQARRILDELEQETLAAIRAGYSANVVVHAFALTAAQYGIGRELIAPFFASMRADLTQRHYDAKAYQEYIYGSAEVVGLMCLKVFCATGAQYKQLKPAAQALGAAFQKVNFLRDLAADNQELRRVYFPGINFDTMDDADKQRIVADIRRDLAAAEIGIRGLPPAARPAVAVAARYYTLLLHKIERTPLANIKTTRVRIANGRKLLLLGRAFIAARVGRLGNA